MKMTATMMNGKLLPLIGKRLIHPNMEGEITRVEIPSEKEIVLYIGQSGICKVVSMWGDIVPIKCDAAEQKSYGVGNFLLGARIGDDDLLKVVGDLITA